MSRTDAQNGLDFHFKVVPEQSRKVEYERERLLGIANK
jgi:hypothetical protein